MTGWSLIGVITVIMHLLHGFPKDKLKKMIVAGKSMSINSRRYKFFSSSIVGGGIPIALGLALALKKKSQHKVWLFVGGYDI